MAYTIHGFIIRESSFITIKGLYKNILKSQLNKCLLFIPLTEELYDEINTYEGNDLEGFDYLTDKILDFIREISKELEIGYIEAEYFGGDGYQNGLFYRDSKCILKCVNDETAINKVLQGLKVENDPNKDEFDTVGLGRYRRNEEWMRLEH